MNEQKHEEKHETKHRSHEYEKSSPPAPTGGGSERLADIFLQLCISNHEIESALVVVGAKVHDFLLRSAITIPEDSGPAEAALTLYMYYFRRQPIPEWFAEATKDILRVDPL